MTELQNGWGWQGLKVNWSTCLKQGHLELFAQDHIQSSFEYLQGWRLYSGQPVPVLNCQSVLVVPGAVPQVQDFSFLLNFTRFLSAHFSSMSGSLWMAARPSGVSVTPAGLIWPANLLGMHSYPIIHTINKDVEQDWVQYWPLGNLLDSN